MTGAVASAAVNSAAEPVGFERVLAGVGLAGPAAVLAGRLDLAFLTRGRLGPGEPGVDAAGRASAAGPDGVPGRWLHVHRARGSDGRCVLAMFHQAERQGLTGPQIASAAELPSLPDRPAGCAVPGCQRMSPTPRSTLCAKHSRRFRRRPGRSVEQFLTDPGVRPLPALGPCRVAACTRTAESEHGYCSTHYVRWRTAVVAEPDTDQRRWELTATAVSEGGQVSLRGLPPLVVIEVLFGVQQRVQGGAKVKDVTIRGVCDTLRRQQAPTVGACTTEGVPTKATRVLLTAVAREVRRALTDPARERAGDDWDLAVFGHPGRLSFAGISQPWLARAAKAWAGEELPRHRGGGATKVREKVNALARLSESLRLRDDHGLSPDQLGRKDIEAFLNRLA